MAAKRYRSVWDAIEPTPALAASMKARAEVMIRLQKAVTGQGLTQSEAAKQLGISQPRLNDLMRGRIDRFSLDALVDLAVRADLSVHVRVTKRAA